MAIKVETFAEFPENRKDNTASSGLLPLQKEIYAISKKSRGFLRRDDRETVITGIDQIIGSNLTHSMQVLSLSLQEGTYVIFKELLDI